ncbi:type VII secretion [Chlorella sorokiniana]|uniref:Type VII secretion n=1 Tax=Chlorella sorokiniana TaxID=3076 RepID=A0A2P6TG31_CHLSO|nr:type VII secretion [Chlorella sorokiniana]|eukprot:PRW33064.1 type VII secretion [Chlorella sorokiniana]
MVFLRAVALACLLAALQAAPAAAVVPADCLADAPVVTESAEQLKLAVERVTTFPTTLDARIFNNVTEVFDGQMRPDVRDAAIALVERNFAAMDLPPEFTLESVELQGSAASYEWDELADLGIHAFIAVNGSVCPTSCKAPEGPVCQAVCQYDGLAKMYNSFIEGEQEATFTDAQGRTSAEPSPDTGVLLNGVVAEVTILATKPPNQMPVNGTGLYSFTTDSWVMEPTEQPDNWDRAEILGNVTQFVDEYNALLCEYETAKAMVLPAAPGALDFNCSRWADFSKKLKKYRGTGFDANLGSRSTSNLAYRLLRRISVNVVDQPGVWEQQCINLKASLPNKLLDAGTTFSSAPAPTAAPASAAWTSGLSAVALAAALAMALLAA